MNEEIIKNEQSDLPWLVFLLSGKAYAVNSKFVDAIEMLSEHITPMPESPDIYKGLVERRGDVYPVLDMRKVFGYSTLDEEVAAFNDMMEQRKQDHINWVNTLEDCARNGKEFKLATDPHKCAFGKWYDAFVESNRSSAMHIKKVEQPHRLLHESAAKVLAASAKGDTETVETLLKQAREVYVPKVLAVLDDAEHAYRDTFRETVVVLSDGKHLLGLLVDEVLAVGKIKFVSGNKNMSLLSQAKYFTGVARNDRTKLEILVIDEEQLMAFADVNTRA